MKKSLALLAGAGLGLGVFLGAPHLSAAQAPDATPTPAPTPAPSGPFADVPADHWAYQAVATLQSAGIVIGYPDGTYGGKRAMTRYEFAVAIARLLPLIKPPDLTPYAQKTDLQALSDDLNAKLSTNSQAIDALKALTTEFSAELTKLGQDVTAINARLDALEARVAAVEVEQRRVKFNGAMDLIARGDVDSNSLQRFTDKNGTVTGLTGPNAILAPNTKRITADTAVYHNFDLLITGKVSDTATAIVRANFQNYLSAVGNTANVGRGVPTQPFTGDLSTGAENASQSTQTSLREAYLDAPVALGPLGGATLDVGRIPLQFSKYTLKQVDADVYTNLYETDSGNLITDGGKIALKAGPVKLLGFAGKYNSTPWSQPYVGSSGTAVDGVFASGQTRPKGQIFQNTSTPINQGAGVRASVGSPSTIQVNGTVEEFGLTATSATPTDPVTGKAYNKLTVYGADANGTLPFGLGPIKKGGIGVDASITNSIEGGMSTNAAYGYKYMQHEEQASLQFSGLTVKGGYQYVGPYFSAPGYWGKLGAWTNPTNIEGPVVSAKYAVTPKVTVNGEYNQYKAAYGGTTSPLQLNDRINRYQVGLGYGLSSDYAVDLGYEDVMYDLRNNSNTLTNAGKPHETYWTLGLGHTFNPNASLKLLYQIIRYNDKSTGFDPIAASNGGEANGGVAIGQFELKF